jgi:hypothetical protein
MLVRDGCSLNISSANFENARKPIGERAFAAITNTTGRAFPLHASRPFQTVTKNQMPIRNTPRIALGWELIHRTWRGIIHQIARRFGDVISRSAITV